MNVAIGMKAPQLKIGLTALFVLALGWIAWSFHSQVQLQWAFPPIKYRKGEISGKKIGEKIEALAPTKTEKAFKRRSPEEYRVLYELNITGKEKPRPVDPVAAPVAVVKAVASILKIGYTQLVSDDSKDSRAYVLYTDPMITQPLKEGFLHIGDHLPSPFSKYFVVEIQPRIVVFGEDGSDKKEEVGLSNLDFTFSGIQASAGSGRLGSRSGQLFPPNYSTPAETTEVAPGEYWISYQEAKQFESGYQGAIRDVQSSDYYDPKTRKPAGVKVDGLGPNSIATKYGVQQGDIIKSINGNPVSSKAQAIEWAKKNPDLPSYTVEIERLGKIITKTYVPPPKKK